MCIRDRHHCASFLSIAARTCRTWYGLAFSFVVLNVHARVAGPRRLEDGMGSAGGARRAEVIFTNLVEILVADVLGVVSHARDDLVHGRHPLMVPRAVPPVSYTHLRAHETVLDLVCRLLLEK